MNYEVVIGLEGFSYGSISSSTLDLAMYNSFLRMKLIENLNVQLTLMEYLKK